MADGGGQMSLACARCACAYGQVQGCDRPADADRHTPTKPPPPLPPLNAPSATTTTHRCSTKYIHMNMYNLISLSLSLVLLSVCGTYIACICVVCCVYHLWQAPHHQQQGNGVALQQQQKEGEYAAAAALPVRRAGDRRNSLEVSHALLMWFLTGRWRRVLAFLARRVPRAGCCWFCCFR